ncbi:hypothetical protein HPB51_018441 [Rhipicephalus microplus]|uniref:Uncharacterized protein n=1 Tax=Rhipicephalus microplus TaxID=6941 RepID=A0A9J6EIJ8_RHIMP|nr:hypothetical protein HPB51_018441 [Rhipicephalus microplus]
MERQYQVFHAQGSVTKTAQLKQGLYETASQLLQAKDLKTKKEQDAKAGPTQRHGNLSVLWVSFDSISAIKLRLSEVKDLQKVSAGKTNKPPAKPTQNKRHKLSQESLATASNTKAEKAPQSTAAFYLDRYIVYSNFELTYPSTSTDGRPQVEKEEEVARQPEMKAEKVQHIKECEMCHAKRAQEKQKCYWALYKEEQIKVRGDYTLRKAPLKLCEKRQQKRHKKWYSSTENV